MAPSKVTRKLMTLVALLFCWMTGCLCWLSALTIHNLRNIQRDQVAHAKSFVPAKRLAASFEREILNARIFFIYFVTIQKPGSLESGWVRYHKAEAAVHDLRLLIDQQADLSNLRTPAAKLQADVDSYGVTLAQVLSMVQGGETKGPHYDAMVKEWAAKGAIMVGDAASLENLCFRSGEANSSDISAALGNGQTQTELILASSFLLSLALVLLIHLRLKHMDDGSPTAPSAPIFPAGAEGLGAH